ncbi:MAG: cell division protein FtsZ [Bergeyella sp.]|nr:cell division protein FtsZ [Bergeyella sp.]
MDELNNQGFSFDLPKGNSSIIKVIGVGGGGNNALKHMYEKGIHGVDFVVCNTDSQTLENNPVTNKVQLGITITEGLGAGADPEVGEKAAIESMDDIKAALGQNTKMAFITAGMGGGTGTGAAPIIAKIAKEMGILTIGIVTVPFSFEGRRRLEQAEMGLEKMRNSVDSLIVVNNDKLRQQFGNLGFKQGFSKADEVLTNAAKGMAEVITGYFDVNIDFRDAKSVLENSGTALMSSGIASGENKAEEAVRKALDSPLLNDNKIMGAKNVLLLIRSGSEEATMDEIGLINDYIQKEAGNTADIIFGVGTDEDLGESISVLVIATGFAKDEVKYSGVTEKIKYRLQDEPSETRDESFPFQTKEEKQSVEKKSFSISEEKNRLDSGMLFSLNTEERDSSEGKDFVSETSGKMVLFSDEKEEYLPSEGMSFDFSGKEFSPEKREIKDESSPIEVSFVISTSEENETGFTLKNVPKEVRIPPKKTKENIPQNLKRKSQAKNEDIYGEDAETQESFTFIQKSTIAHEEKVVERRNKLKEFNSRYLATEVENEFESVPAFRRKNIPLELNNSKKKIQNFLSEDPTGNLHIKENQFLNKDVD